MNSRGNRSLRGYKLGWSRTVPFKRIGAKGSWKVCWHRHIGRYVLYLNDTIVVDPYFATAAAAKKAADALDGDDLPTTKCSRCGGTGSEPTDA